MKNIIFTLVLTAMLFSCTKESDTTINYTISHIIENNIPVLNIKMSFNAEDDGETTLLFQDKAWGQDSLHNGISSMKLLSAEGAISKQRDSGWIVIKHPKDLKTIDFEYSLSQEKQGDLRTEDVYRPVIHSEYFQVFSHNLFMLPKSYANTSEGTFNVELNWENFPEEFNIQNSFGSNNRHQKIENTSEDEFHSAVFVGGDFRIHTIEVKNNKVSFAIRDDWEVFNDSTMVDILENTISAQRDFWRDHSQEYFSVTMIPTELDRGSSFHGTGLTNSFATDASNNNSLQVEGLVYLFNHELQHNWTGLTIQNDNEEEQYWFSEGFTDYYALKNIAKNNIYNLDEGYFIKEFNGFIRALFSSPVKEAPNREINYDNFWSNRDYEKLPYRRGALFAFYLDYKIKQDSNGTKSLDDLMLVFKENAIHKKITHAYFIEEANAFLKEDLSPFFNTHIEQGKLLDLETIFGDYGFDYKAKAKVFDLGITFSDEMITAVNESSSAYKAGLRVGDRIVSRSYYYDNVVNNADFVVLRNGKKIAITYIPVKEVNIAQLIDSEKNRINFGF